MLMLSRKLDESIIILCPDGTKIELKVSSISRKRVVIGTDAPLAYNVVRKELLKDKESN